MDNNTIRLKAKIDDHEFEMEGTPEYVREQYQAWQELVKLTTTAKATAPQIQQQPVEQEANNGQRSPLKQETTTVDSSLQKILRVDNRVISLTARLNSVHDAILVMLYGQKTLRNNEGVTGAEINDGLSATGGYTFSRLDRFMDKLAEDGDVMAFGERRGKRYRLTNTGIAKARQIASDLIASVA
jgi:hypothetical protein